MNGCVLLYLYMEVLSQTGVQHICEKTLKDVDIYIESEQGSLLTKVAHFTAQPYSDKSASVVVLNVK